MDLLGIENPWLIVFYVVVLGHSQERTCLAGSELIVVTGVACRLACLALLLVAEGSQRLLNFNSLSFFEFVLLLERVICDYLVVDTVVKLAIVIEFILSVNLPTFLREAKYLLFDLHELHYFRRNLVLTNGALLAHRRVERRQNDRFRLLVLQRAVLRLQVVLREAVDRLFVLVTVVAAAVVVGVLFLDHFALFVVKELHRGVHTT